MKNYIIIISVFFLVCSELSAQKTITFVACDESHKEKIYRALFHARTVVNSPAFQKCLQTTYKGTQRLITNQESSWVGPYVPCDGTGRYRDVTLNWNPPGGPRFSNDWSYSLTLALRRMNYSNIRFECDFSLSSTAATPFQYTYGWMHEEDIVIQLSERVFNGKPGHEPRQAPEGGYPIDELAGIILHEILHSHKFSHGTSSSNQCGYDSYLCTNDSFDGNSCRMNSLPEIVEACASEILEASIGIGGCGGPPRNCGYASLYLMSWLPPHGNSVDESSEDCECVKTPIGRYRWPVKLRLVGIEPDEVSIIPKYPLEGGSGLSFFGGECDASSRIIETQPDGSIILTSCVIEEHAEFEVKINSADCKTCYLDFPFVNNKTRMPAMGFREPVEIFCDE